jgi:FkbM family methyltransferase
VSLKSRINKTGIFSQVLRSGINRFAPDGKTTVEVASGGLVGTKLSLYLKSEKDYWLGTYESELQEVLRQKVAPGMVVYDLGANIGYLSFLLSKLVDETGLVYAFEALPENIARIEENLSLNPEMKNIKIIPKAVIDKCKEIGFLIGPSGSTGKTIGSGGRQNVNYQSEISIDGISIDHFVYNEKKPKPDLVKIDIEGGEVLALAGLERVFKQYKPVVLLELHGSEAAEVSLKILRDAGYEIYLIKHGYLRIQSPDEIGWKSHILAEKKI